MRSTLQVGMNVCNAVKVSTHYKCRNGVYPRSRGVLRFTVPDEKVSWDVTWDGYSPIDYTSDAIINQPWADPNSDEPRFQPQWNSLDGAIDRRSHFTKYEIRNDVPVNPIGRTGMTGRGCLGRWGPNHAADPIVTRWKRNECGEIERDANTQKPILQFVAIKRRDSQEWAIPGGMVDPGEHVSTTLKREFMEEALNILCADNMMKSDSERLVNNFFMNGLEIYRGYVDDPRNTDNSWMETVAMNFHDDDGTSVGRFRFQAGDDAIGVNWLDLHSKLQLYASHSDLLRAVANARHSFW